MARTLDAGNVIRKAVNIVRRTLNYRIIHSRLRVAYLAIAAVSITLMFRDIEYNLAYVALRVTTVAICGDSIRAAVLADRLRKRKAKLRRKRGQS